MHIKRMVEMAQNLVPDLDNPNQFFETELCDNMNFQPFGHIMDRRNLEIHPVSA